MNILALDLGTKLGVCYNAGSDLICESKLLATDGEIKAWGKQRADRKWDPRIKRLHDYVSVLNARHVFEFIVFEDVEFASSRKQTQLWASLRTAVWLAGVEHINRFECVNVKTLKKFATTSGNADKTYMRLAMKTQFPSIWKKELDDNAIDAFWIHRWATVTLARTPLDRNINR